MAWSTLCIYGFGLSQLISDSGNKQVESTALNELGAVYTYLASIEQQGTDIEPATTHIINIFNEQYVQFIPNDIENNAGQVFDWGDIDPATLEALAAEIENI